MKKLIVISIVLNVLFFKTGLSNTITGYLKPAPINVISSVEEELASTNKTLKKLSKKSPVSVGKKLLKNQIKELVPKESGFLCLYGGYVDCTDKDGNYSFPLLHKEPLLYVAITPEIKPIVMYGTTVSHKALIPNKPVKIYKFEKQTDEDGLLFWRIQEEPRSENNRLHPFTLTILTKPKNIFVPIKDSITEEDLNVVLPSMYVVGNIDRARSVLNFLDIKRFFEPIEIEKRTAPDEPLVDQVLMKNN